MTNEAIEFQGLKYPMAALQVLLAQSASAEVRRKYEREGEDIFEILKGNEEFQTAFLDSVVTASKAYVKNVLPYLPEKCTNILDIGCGIGLVPLLIHNYLQGEKPKLYLFDQSVDMKSLTPADIAPTGFNETYKFTASLEITKQFLLLNGVEEKNIALCEVGAWSLEGAGPFDCVISRKSWGFHYPIDEYLGAVSKELSSTGIVITDVRRGQQGIEKMQAVLSDVAVISEEKKSDLVRGHKLI
ncbi:hypothetical protein [Pseudomonas sp. FP198]|uniref:hypothetical protein n=1 Tax=Pseudomonas sp. FP198 TaxID=2954084 RepID=UPI002735C593|nr:hypothetical protein [Pseudomonas sp. FP198]WLG97381.1 hypothetical protein PSH78_08390 [Pseudomonas sp. FP198]